MKKILLFATLLSLHVGVIMPSLPVDQHLKNIATIKNNTKEPVAIITGEVNLKGKDLNKSSIRGAELMFVVKPGQEQILDALPFNIKDEQGAHEQGAAAIIFAGFLRTGGNNVFPLIPIFAGDHLEIKPGRMSNTLIISGARVDEDHWLK